jgi:BirA family biotin operon repressor/biotin-[acetyl-CoA-carboxylase] ligase
LNWQENNILPATILLEKISSTNDYLKDLCKNNLVKSPFSVCAKYQTDGKGMRGHRWNSDSDKNLLVSFLVDKNFYFTNEYDLNVVSCLSVLHIIGMYIDEEVRFKWPNDIFINDKKLAGILIENVYEGMKRAYSVVGIGLNVNQKVFDKNIKACSIIQFTKNTELDRMKILGILQDKFYQLLQQPQTQNLKKFNQYLYQKNEWSTFETTTEDEELKVLDVLPNGNLKVENKDGTHKQIKHPTYRWKK